MASRRLGGSSATYRQGVSCSQHVVSLLVGSQGQRVGSTRTPPHPSGCFSFSWHLFLKPAFRKSSSIWAILERYIRSGKLEVWSTVQSLAIRLSQASECHLGPSTGLCSWPGLRPKEACVRPPLGSTLEPVSLIRTGLCTGPGSFCLWVYHLNTGGIPATASDGIFCSGKVMYSVLSILPRPGLFL